MGRLARLAARLRGDDPDAIRVRVILRGRIGSGWYDVDRRIAVPPGATLGHLLEAAERVGVPLRAAIAESPHLAHTLMWNGERCAVEAHRDRRVEADDEIYLLGPLAGG
jgi:hypothetical protein